ncbi:MAG: hypothetical protein KBC00_01945 [Candidatus Levybacteria bacterium]|nr:hypothetical protein [Candidatus Levybacteria bacterium]MBP9815086.1 hypothetical protein [Candidatus Levybacteria bacterium]
MSVKLWLIIGAAVVIFAGLFGFMYLQSMTNRAATNTMMKKSSSTESSAFSSLSDIFTNKSLSLTCDFIDKEGKKTKIYIKSGKVRAEITGNEVEDSGNVIVKEDTMYFWNGTQGMMMKYDTEKMKGDNAQNLNAVQGQAVLQGIEQYRQSCSPAVVSDSLFTPPVNIKFQDLSEMMKIMPSGATVPSINPSQYQDLMEQYQQ